MIFYFILCIKFITKILVFNIIIKKTIFILKMNHNILRNNFRFRE